METPTCEVCGRAGETQEERHLIDTVGLCRQCNPTQGPPHYAQLQVIHFPGDSEMKGTTYQKRRHSGRTR